MTPQRNRTASAVERFFQFSLLGLVTTGFLALAATRYLDRPTLVLTSLALILRALVVSRAIRMEIPSNLVSFAALAYIVFYPADLYYISHDFLAATIHGVCFLGGIKILTARTNRDYLYIGAIAFIELIGAALLSFQASFFLFLALCILFAIAAFTSGEIRRGFTCAGQTVYSPDARVARRLTTVAVAATCGILFVTAGLFLLVPRTARAAAMLFPHAPYLTGFTGVVDLGAFGEIAKDDRPVMHILSYSKNLPPNLKWRGGALSSFDGRRWFEPISPKLEISLSHGTAEVADRLQRSRRDGRRFLYRVEGDASGTGTLFIAGVPEYINVAAARLIRTRGDAFRALPAIGETLQYEVSAHSGPPLPEALGPERNRYLRVPPIDTRIWTLARQWAGAGEPFERAERIEGHLRRDYVYALENPAAPQTNPLGNFLFVTKRGYCEYFASAMAVMLRTLGIPSRVATGFQSGYYNEVSGLYVLRASDAHVWVEAWFEDRGWVTFDPTPSAANVRAQGIFSRIAMYLDAMDSMWRQWVVAYDLGHQAALATRFARGLRSWNRNWSAARPAGAGSFLLAVRTRAQAMGWWALAAASLMALAMRFGPRALRTFRHRAIARRILRSGGSPSDASMLYLRMLDVLAARGVERPPWFTPAEFARQVPADQREAVAKFTAVYNAIRFGDDNARAGELVTLLDHLGQR